MPTRVVNDGERELNPFPNSFTDSFDYTIDQRGRINFPAPFRRALSDESKDRVVITRGLDGCLFVFPRDVWEKHLLEFNRSPYSLEQQRRLQRLLASGARESTFDAQGRITIPQKLIELARLEKDVLIIGMGDRVELWNPGIYDKYITAGEETAESILEKFLSGSSLKTDNSTGSDA